MSTLAFVVAFCIVAVLVYMARFSGRLRVVRARTIDAPLAMVYAKVADLRQWQTWNPWLEHEPDADVALSGASQSPGGACTWDTPALGSGRITHLRLKPPHLIEQQLRFAHPFRYRGVARWQLTAQGQGTLVTWSMRGRVGWLMRAFSKTVQEAIALDFRYGLDRLAATLESRPGAAYRIEYLGLRDIAASHFATLPYRGPLKGLGAARRELLVRAAQELARAGVSDISSPVAIYIRTNVRLRTTDCRIGWATGAASSGSLSVHQIPAHRAYVVRLVGSPEALEVAWYHAMQRLRVENVEPDLRIAPFERYLTHPATTAPEDQVTELHLAVRPPNPGRPRPA